ncbi:MAG TPA: stage II sporulation protein E, partial [Phycisphaerales bacterium]|nr:stage II sporulation protein E [Phycisphaerales bacterium]
MYYLRIRADVQPREIIVDHTDDNQPASAINAHQTDWERRLHEVTEMMREMSSEDDPQEMVKHYRERANRIFPVDAYVSLSRRGLEYPFFRITRASIWDDELDPWKHTDKLPIYDRGIFQELLYTGLPVYLPNLKIDEADPAHEYMGDCASVIAIPAFDDGVARNMYVMAQKSCDAFNAEEIPDMVWRTNLFGRATHNLVLKRERDRAYEQVDSELRTVAGIQRSLLPAELPKIETLDIAAHYETSTRAGGDYYDVFNLSDGRRGFLIADVCGHGTPAAVLMAITHALAHTIPIKDPSPSQMLGYINEKLVEHYTNDGTFVTAFYCIFDPVTRDLIYASAGHNPPRVKRCSDGSMFILDQAQGIPLGISET